MAARAAGIQAIDGPYGLVGDTDGLVQRSRLARALGLDGKWTIHPDQIAVVNEIFAPTREEFARASAMLAALSQASDGAAMFAGEMVDEASRKMAERVVLAGEAAGYRRVSPRAAQTRAGVEQGLVAPDHPRADLAVAASTCPAVRRERR